MGNLSHIFEKRVSPVEPHEWTDCERRVAEAVAYIERGEMRDGLAMLAHALVTNDRPDAVTLRRLFREITEAAGTWRSE